MGDESMGKKEVDLKKQKAEKKRIKKEKRKQKFKTAVRLCIAIIMILVIYITYKTIENGGGISRILGSTCWT